MDLAERAAVLELLSHELRTPVTSIHVAVTILRGRRALHKDEDLRSELVDDIAAETLRLLRVVEDVLAVAHLEAGIEPGREPVLFQRLVPQVLAAERRQQPDVDIGLREVGTLPPLRGDETGVRHVVRNFVADVRDAGQHITVELAATDAAGAVVRVIGARTAVSGSMARLDVHPPKDEARGRVTRPETSLGLYVCRRLGAAMGGRTCVQRRSDGRLQRSLWLPAYP
jgi:signal transduction histidine kinase